MTERPINFYQTSFLSQANKHRSLKSSKKPLNNEMNAWKFPLQKYAGNWRQLIFTDASMNLSNLSGFAWTNLLDRADARGQNYIEGEKANEVKLTPRIGNISDQPLWSIPHDTQWIAGNSITRSARQWSTRSPSKKDFGESFSFEWKSPLFCIVD